MIGTSLGKYLKFLGISCAVLGLLMPGGSLPALAEFAEQAAQPAPTTAPAVEPGAPTEPREAAILDPTQGHPLILRPGESFRFLMRLGPGLGGNVTVFLRHGRVETLTVALAAAGEMTIFQERYATAELRLPTQTPTGIYDLVLASPSRSVVARHSIKVVDEFKPRFRFVHLSDMTVDDPSAPVFDDRLVEEINLLAPEFIVATGDYTAWGRALDDPTTWPRVLAFFARFDAPVYMVCGELDHQASFTEYVAQSPVGTFDYGRYHGILLMDHAAHPLDRDQLDFLRRDLDAHTDSVFTIIALHNDDLSFLDLLAPRAELAEYLRSRKVRLIITGGSDDWDRTEYAAKLEGLEDVHYIRTQQSSTSLRGRATGISHYRVIEVDGEKVSYVYANDGGAPGIEHSIPAGSLRAFVDAVGTRRVAVNIQNALNQRFDGARLWVQVAKNGEAKPQVAGGRLVQALNAGDAWACEVAADLPDKGGLKILVSTEGKLPEPVPIKASYEGSHDLAFRAERTKAGLSFFKSDQPLTITLANSGERELRTYPIVRLNGSRLPVEADGRPDWPITIPPGGQAILALRLILGQVSAGEHLMQLVFLEDPLRRVTAFPVTLKKG